MKRNIILAAVIGTLAAHLPFWIWDGGVRAVGAVALGVISFIWIFGSEERGGTKDDEATARDTGDA